MKYQNNVIRKFDYQILPIADILLKNGYFENRWKLVVKSSVIKNHSRESIRSRN